MLSVSDTSQPITALLARWSSGDETVEETLIKSIYPILMEKARLNRIKHKDFLTLDTREVANEAYLALIKLKHLSFNDRVHFHAIAAKVTRQLVIDHLRKRSNQRSGGGQKPLALDEIEDQVASNAQHPVDWLSIDQALSRLAEVDPICAKVVEMKFFSGMTGEEIALACDCSEVTIRRKWRFARAWLSDGLDPPTAD